MTAFDQLADLYEAGRIGYSTELYNMLAGFGLNPRHTVIDVGCGTGLSARPLIENGFHVTGIDLSEPMLEKARARFPGTWIKGAAEKIPFPDATFDAAVCAQTIHHVDREASVAEIARVVKPGGLVAFWWKTLSGEDPVKLLRDEVAASFGEEIPSGLEGGFKEFYAGPFEGHTLRVLPWQAMTGLEEFVLSERSRSRVQKHLGDRAESYFRTFERKLHEQYGEGNPRIALDYVQFLYCARNR